MEGGFFGGLASGLQTGLQDARQRQVLQMQQQRQNFEQELQSRAEKRAEDQFSHQKDVDAMQIVGERMKQLQLAAASMRPTDPDYEHNLKDIHDQSLAMTQAQRNLYLKMGGPDLKEAHAQTAQTVQDMHSGDRQMKDFTPSELWQAVHMSTGLDPSQLMDPQSKPVMAANAVTKILQNGGDPSEAIPHLSDLHPSITDAHNGMTMYDGSTVTGSRIVNALPHPNDPSQTVLLGQFDVVNPNGIGGQFTQPYMGDPAHIAAHPNDSTEHPVATMPTKDLVHNTLAQATAIQASQHPEIQDKLSQMSDADKKHQDYLRQLTIATGGAIDFTPKQEIKQIGNQMIITRASDGAIIGQIPIAKSGPDRIAEGLADAIERGDKEGIAKYSEAQDILKGGPMEREKMREQNALLLKQMQVNAQYGAGGLGGTENLSSQAKAIAEYRLPPPTARQMTTPQGRALMNAVLEVSPQYNAQDYASSQKAYNDFTSGKAGATLRFLSTAIDHLDTLQSLGDALKNNDARAFNQVANFFSEQTGNPAPTNFKAAAQIVGNEVMKAISNAGVGAVSEREELGKRFSAASSPEQLTGVIKSAQKLLAGQAKSLKRQYEVGTKRKDFEQFLSPEAADLLLKGSSQGLAPAAKTPALPAGWSIEKVQ